jgi:hypothetical protein
MELDHLTIREQGVTFVSVFVHNPHDESARFRVEHALDGPLWPPRTRGVPEAGWDSNGYEGTLEAGAHLALGYATPASPSDPPARLVWAEPAGDRDVGPDGESTRRRFADPRPPRSVVSPTSPVHFTRRPSGNQGRMDAGDCP